MAMSFLVPPVDEIAAHAIVVSLPLRVPFRGIRHREVMLLRGANGPAEWAAFPEYSDGEAALWLSSALEQGFDPSFPETRPQVFLPVNATFPALDAQDVEKWFTYFPGVHTAKIKVAERGTLLEVDIARVREVRRVVGPDVALRIDANGAWTFEESLAALRELAQFRIDYVEQPVATAEEMVRLGEQVRDIGIRLAADELIRKQVNPEKNLDLSVASVAVMKVGPLGGLRRTLRLANYATSAGMEVVISSGLETSVGLTSGLLTAAELRRSVGAISDTGLGTACFFESDVVSEPLTVVNGHVQVNTLELDPARVKQLAVSPVRQAWWRTRLERCYETARQILEGSP